LIAIVDYGIGNLHSVSKAVARLGYSAEVTSEPSRIMDAEGVILPGVGAFGDAMAQLRAGGLDRTMADYAASGRPLLGICLGMQLLFTRSEEHGLHEGLNLLPGDVVRFRGNIKVPHMGWNRLSFLRPSPLLDGLEEGHVYFVHSYYALPENEEHLLAVTDYHGRVAAVVGSGNIYGMQFHPEKSGELGMRLLANFLGLTVRLSSKP